MTNLSDSSDIVSEDASPQKQRLKDKVTRAKATQFYEATYDPLYGAGFSILDTHKGMTTPKPNCTNYTGRVLAKRKAKCLKG